jgi:hypothetical protein
MVGENLRSQQNKLDRRQHRQELLDGCIDMVAWEVVPAGEGACDLAMSVRSKVGAIIELRPFYQQWFADQSVHQLPAGEVTALRRPLELGRPSEASEWIALPTKPCDTFDFRDFRFIFRCGGDPAVVIHYQSSATPTETVFTFGPAPTIRPLPIAVNETRH